jgi:hypothetical protein
MMWFPVRSEVFPYFKNVYGKAVKPFLFYANVYENIPVYSVNTF